MFNDPVMVQAAAARYQLPPLLITAVIEQESRGKSWAWNPEPKYRWFWDVKAKRAFRTPTAQEVASEVPPADFPMLAGDRDQEWWGQQASWGLMQCMGAVARERGFAGDYLSELCDPRVGINYGCSQLMYLKIRHLPRYNWRGVLAAYNTGSPETDPGSAGEKYSSEVMGRLPKGVRL